MTKLSSQSPDTAGSQLAGEENQQREEENTILLSISNEIAHIRGKEDMLHVILNTLRQYIHFDDSFILKYNETNSTSSPYIFHAKKARSTEPEFKNYLSLDYYVVNNSTEDFLYPIVYDVASMMTGGSEQISFMHSSGIKEFVVLKLIVGSQLVGLFILLSEQKNSFMQEDLDLLQKISFQISTATANIIATEEIEKKEEEKEILLSLGQGISLVRAKNDLLTVLAIRLKELFPITGFVITLLNEDNQTHSPFIVDPLESVKKDVQFKEVIDQKYSISDTVFSEIIKTDEPIILEVDNLAVMAQVPGYVILWKKAGIKQVLGMPLRVGQKNLGCLIFHLDSPYKNSISGNLLKGVCAQISVRVSNIIANEEIKKREEEKTILLALSNEISVLKNRHDLLQIVNNTIKKLFSIEELEIAKIDENGDTYSAFMLDIGEDIVNGIDFTAATPNSYDVNDALFSKIMNSDDPVIFKIDEIAGLPGMPAFVNFWKKIGLEQVLCTALRAGGRNIGWLALHIDTNNTINPKSILLKGVCVQLSVALSNILANEEIVRREKERELLLSLNLDIAGVRNNQELLSVINQRLKKLLGFSHTVIGMINEDKTTVRVFLLDPESKSKNHPEYMKKDKYQIDDGVLPDVFSSPAPFVYDLTQMSENDEMPIYFKVNLESGMEQAVLVRFSKGDEALGVWIIIFSKKITLGKSSLSLIGGLANQLSVSISNIIANEEIARREKERELLLSLNIEIAAIRTRSDLLQIINQKLKKTLSFTHTLIVLINDDRVTASGFLIDPASISKSKYSMPQAMEVKYPFNDGVMNKVFSSREPVVFDLDQLNGEQKLPFYFKMNYDSGIRQAVITRFFRGAQVHGFWMFFFKEKITLDRAVSGQINGLTNQISIAISNIIANQEIQQREEEKSRLLAFSNAMASSRDKAVIGKILTQQLKEVFGVKGYYMLYALSSDKETYYPILFDPGASLTNLSDDPKFEIMIRSDNLVADSILQKILDLGCPTVFNVEERFNKPMTPAYAKMMSDRGITKITGAPIKLGDENIGVILFDTNNMPLGIQEPLLKGICSQIAISVSNIIADDEIQGREKQKSLLLEFSNAIASVRDKSLLANILNQQLKELFGIKEYAIHVLSEDKSTHRPFFMILRLSLQNTRFFRH